MWVVALAWWGLCLAAYYHRDTDTGIRLTKIDEAIRFVVIPVLMICSIASLLGYRPFGTAPGQLRYSAKILMYSFALCIGLYLRFVMREWTVMFRVLAQGPNPQVEAKLEKELRRSKLIAYLYWIIIMSVAFLGATKPF